MRITRRVGLALTGTTLFAAAAVLAAAGPPAAAIPLPPVPGVAAAPLVGEGVTVEGPLVNNVNPPTLT